MVKVKLHGKLGKEFKKEWSLDVKSGSEALKAIDVNTNHRFSNYILETLQKKDISYIFIVNGYQLSCKEDKALLLSDLGDGDQIDVIPEIGGFTGVFETFVFNLIIAIFFQVVSNILAKDPRINTGKNSDDARKESFLFSSQARTVQQGLPVPLGYGRMLVSPYLVSVEYRYDDTGSGGGTYNPGFTGDGGGGAFQDPQTGIIRGNTIIGHIHWVEGGWYFDPDTGDVV